MSQKILNYGSINIDHVYQVSHFVRPGETLTSGSLTTGLGGKGANQSAAIARAGGEVLHIGQISNSDQWVLSELLAAGVNTSPVRLTDGPSGHAIIQVDDRAENAIIVHGGANQQCCIEAVQACLEEHRDAAYLLLQNECNALADVIDIGLSLGLKVVLNPAPMSAEIGALPLSKLDTLILNEIEAKELSGQHTQSEIIHYFAKTMPDTRVVLTLGKQGAILIGKNKPLTQPAFVVDAIDTTGAGDTFVGYLLSAMARGIDDDKALQIAAAAAALTVQKAGAISSIPTAIQVQEFLDAQTDY